MILVELKEGHKPTASYIKKLRQVLPAEFPENIFYFQPADMVTQILNFGIPSQINVRTVGYNRANNLRIAQELQQRIAAIPGVADVHLQQEINGPEFFAQIDRARASQFGLTVNDIALNLNTASVLPSRWRRISGPIPPTVRPIISPCRHRNTASTTLNELKNTPVTKFTVGKRQPGAGIAQQRRDAETRLDRDQRQPGQHPAAV